MNRRQRRAAARQALSRRMPDGPRANGETIREARRQFAASLIGVETSPVDDAKPRNTRLWTPPR